MSEMFVAAALLALHNPALVTLAGGLLIVATSANSSDDSELRAGVVMATHPLNQPRFYLLLVAALGITGALLPVMHAYIHGHFKQQSAISASSMCLKMIAVAWIVAKLIQWQRLRRQPKRNAQVARVSHHAIGSAFGVNLERRCVLHCLASVAIILVVTPLIVFFQQ